MPVLPDLPEPAHHTVDSMLARKFGREPANYFSGSPLNRVSFLRSNNGFLGSALTHPSASFLLLNNLAPLAKDASTLAYATHKDIKGLVGENPFEKSEKDMINDYNSSKTLPLVILLGIDEAKLEGFEYGKYRGKPYFAVDITSKGTFEKETTRLIETMKDKGLVFIESRLNMTLNAPEAAIYAQARALTDWNVRNPYCAGCGQPTLSINAGAKRVCPPTDFASPPTDQSASITLSVRRQRPSCATRTGISNLSFPRTDTTVIMAVMSHNGDRVLLGRQKRWPPHWYSTLAGFIEPGESIEEAVRREVWEESGVLLGRVVMHSTQPWPYPANLMIGAIGQALPNGETIHLEHDPELQDAKWVDVEKVREALEVGASGLEQAPGEGYRVGELRLPPKTAIANQLLKAAVGGFGDSKI